VENCVGVRVKKHTHTHAHERMSLPTLFLDPHAEAGPTTDGRPPTTFNPTKDAAKKGINHVKDLDNMLEGDFLWADEYYKSTHVDSTTVQLDANLPMYIRNDARFRVLPVLRFRAYTINARTTQRVPQPRQDIYVRFWPDRLIDLRFQNRAEVAKIDFYLGEPFVEKMWKGTKLAGTEGPDFKYPERCKGRASYGAPRLTEEWCKEDVRYVEAVVHNTLLNLKAGLVPNSWEEVLAGKVSGPDAETQKQSMETWLDSVRSCLGALY